MGINYQIYQLNKIYLFIKSNERSEDSYIGLADSFPGNVLKVSNNYRCAIIHCSIYECTKLYMHFLSSIEIHLLKVALIAFSKYERGNGAKNVND